MKTPGDTAYERALLGDRKNAAAAFLRRWKAMLSAAPQQHGQEVDEVERIGRAFLSVLGDPSIAWRNTGAHEFIERVSQATAKQKSSAHQQPAEAVAGEFHECPHCKGWSRTPPPAIDIGKLREVADSMVHRACAAYDPMYDQCGNDTRADMQASMRRALMAALIGGGGERANG